MKLPMKNLIAMILLNPLLEANTIVRTLQITSIVGIYDLNLVNTSFPDICGEVYPDGRSDTGYDEARAQLITWAWEKRLRAYLEGI